MTNCLPPTVSALAELRRTIRERQAYVDSGNAPDGSVYRLDAMRSALSLVEICEKITYFETNGEPAGAGAESKTNN